MCVEGRETQTDRERERPRRGRVISLWQKYIYRPGVVRNFTKWLYFIQRKDPEIGNH